VCLLVLTGCGRDEPTEPPVATPSVTVDRQQVPIGSPLRMTYRFTVAPGTHIDKDYKVFVHVLDGDGESLWGDDHDPAKPTSQWTPGETVEYTRTVFVPNYPYIGPAVVRIGLYDPATGKRLTLAHDKGARQEYEVASFELQPQSENIFLIYKNGWHPAEFARDNPGVEWQWTTGQSTISFRNPRKDGTLYLEYAARPDQFTPPQQVTVRMGDEVIGTFQATAPAPALITFPVTAAQFGTGDTTTLTIDVDRTFTPGDGDTRVLGIQVFHVFVDAK
jgi:hypothetical protein